jgi:hypothetical protein
MRCHGLRWSDAMDKPAMRALILRGGPYTAEERRDILAYNWEDTNGLAALLPRMLPGILARPNGWEFALLRGYFSGHCVADTERRGTPIDGPSHKRLSRNWDGVRARIVAQYDPPYRVYDGLRFVADWFLDYLVREDIPWPLLRSGAPDLRDQTFKEMAELYPQLRTLRHLRHTMAQLRLSSLTVGADGRNRYMHGQFVCNTGRNASGWQALAAVHDVVGGRAAKLGFQVDHGFRDRPFEHQVAERFRAGVVTHPQPIGVGREWRPRAELFPALDPLASVQLEEGGAARVGQEVLILPVFEIPNHNPPILREDHRSSPRRRFSSG